MKSPGPSCVQSITTSQPGRGDIPSAVVPAWGPFRPRRHLATAWAIRDDKASTATMIPSSCSGCAAQSPPVRWLGYSLLG